MNSELWEIDVDKYDDNNIELLLCCKEKIEKALGEENKPTDTLITKIMLGVFANVPAFDRNVKKNLHIEELNKNSLCKIYQFYEEHKNILNRRKIHTLDFLTAPQKTNIIYTKAKLIDMCGFMAGQ